MPEVVIRLPEELTVKTKPDEPSPGEKIKQISESTSRILYKISTTFPLDFFPDTLLISDYKISVVTRDILGSEQDYSIPLKEIVDVTLETIPIFATLKITDNRFKDNPIAIRFLKPKEARKAENIIKGLIIGRDQGIYFASVPPEELLKRLEDLGKTRG